jgi:hypothetical protein
MNEKEDVEVENISFIFDKDLFIYFYNEIMIQTEEKVIP